VSDRRDYQGNTQAFVSAGFLNVSIFDSNFSRSNVTSVKDLIFLPVGEITPITAFLEVWTHSQAAAYYPDKLIDIDFSYADASHTANYFLTPLTEDVSYTSASGRTYFYSGDATSVPTPALLPGLIGLGLNFWRKRRSEAQENQPLSVPAS